jgi:amidase
MPIGFADVDGEPCEGKLPVGMQIVGRRFDEETVLKVAKAWEVPGLGLDTWDGRGSNRIHVVPGRLAKL